MATKNGKPYSAVVEGTKEALRNMEKVARGRRYNGPSKRTLKRRASRRNSA